MQQMHYFTRHGHSTEDALTVLGKEELFSVRSKLATYGFTSKQALSSPTNRCMETVKILAPTTEITPEPELHAFADFQHFLETGGTAPADAPEKWNFSNWEAALERVIKVQPGIICTHDSNAVILALKLLERRHVVVDWNQLPKHLTHLQQGHGVLLHNNTIQHISP